MTILSVEYSAVFNFSYVNNMTLKEDHPHPETNVALSMNLFSIAPIISFVLFLPTYSILGIELCLCH